MNKKINKDHLETFKNNGSVFVKSLFAKEDIEIILEEIKLWTKFSPAINRNGAIFSAHDLLLQNLSIFSKSALSIVLRNDVINFVKSYYKSDIILSKIEYREQLVPKVEMPIHSDFGSSVSFMIYLNGVEDKFGSTYCYDGTHKLNHEKTKINISEFEITKANGEEGSTLVFHSNVLHKRTTTHLKGRKIIWFTFQKLSKNVMINKTLFSRESLANLTKKQQLILGISKKDNISEAFAEDLICDQLPNEESLSFVESKILLNALYKRIFIYFKTKVRRFLNILSPKL